MKTYQAFLLGCCLAAPVRAQGQIAVGNRGVMDGIDAPVFDVDCTTRLEGPAYLAQPYAGLSPDSPSPVGIVLAFRTGERAGYVSLLAVSVPGALDGTVVYVQLRAWEARAGHSFEAAVAAGANTVFRTSYPSWPSWHLAHQTPPSACRASVWCRSRGRGRCWRWAARCWRWPEGDAGTAPVRNLPRRDHEHRVCPARLPGRLHRRSSLGRLLRHHGGSPQRSK